MTFLGMQGGQTLTEFLIAGVLFFLLIFFGLCLLLRGLATTVVVRQASAHSRCLVASSQPERCRQTVSNTLRERFGFQNVNIHSVIVRDIVRTEIRTVFASMIPVYASYDLEPSEYKRVQR